MTTPARVTWLHPDKVQPRFKTFAEAVMLAFGRSLPVTSDVRDPAHQPPEASKTSRHLFGDAVDWDMPPLPNAEVFGALTVAVIIVAKAYGILAQVELELCNSTKDTHAHLAFNPNQTAFKLIIRSD